MIIQTIIEIVIATALIIGFIYEDRIAQAEQKVIKKLTKSPKCDIIPKN